MTLISSAVPGLLGGVSQQPASVRFPNQCDQSDNALASVVDGLVKRPPTDHIAQVITGDPGNAMIHTIDRGVGERYAVVLRDEDAKVFDLTTGSEIEVYDSSGDPADTSDFAYLSSTDPVGDFRAASVADFTFVVNTQQTTAMGAATNDADEEKAFLFIRQSAYDVTYTATLKLVGVAETNVTISTWDGVTPGNLAEEIRVTVTDYTAANPWSGSVLGSAFDANPSTVSNATTASSLSGAIGAIAGVTTTYSGGQEYFFVKCDLGGVPLNLVFDSGVGLSTVVITNDTDTEEDSIKTTELAESFATKIAALSGWSSSAVGSTVEVSADSGTIESIKVEDSVGNTYLKAIWGSVDTITDLPLTCRDGYVTKVIGDPEANQDDYYLKFTADLAGDFGPGVWEETAIPGGLQGFDASTMPHTLIRKFDDVSGTVTGTPNEKYFEWAAYTWTNRIAGDDETNSNPAFVDKKIRGLFLHQNRLGFLADQNMITSETGLYGNFWRTTVLTVVDSDPIDVGAGHTRVSLLNHAVSFNERLYLFSDRTQFSVNESPMTPGNTAIVAAAEYENSPTVGGVALGSSIFFPFQTEGYGRVLELYPTGESPTSVEVVDSTKHIPRYMDGLVKTLSGSTTESLLVATATNRPNCLFVLSYFQQGKQRVQSAWQRFVFGADAEVLSAEFIEEVLYILVKRTEGLFLESMTFGSGIVDSEGTYRVTVDRRLDDTELTSVSYASSTDTTTLTLPYNLDSNQTYQVVTRAVNGKNDAFNLITGTEDFSDASWVSSNVTVTANTTVAPDGETTADTLDAAMPSSNIKQEVAQTPAIGDSYVWSFYVKKDLVSERAECNVSLYNVGNSDIIEQIKFSMDTVNGKLTLLAGSISQGSLGEYSAENLDINSEGDWWRVSATLKYYALDPSGDAVTGTRIEIFPLASASVQRHITIWGVQLLKNDKWEPYNREAGRVLNVASTGVNTIVVNGDYATTPLWVGEQYLMQYKFSEINLKESAASGRGRGVVADAQYYLRHGTILFDNSGYFRLLVKPRHRTATVHQFTTAILGATIGLQSGRKRFSVLGKSDEVDVYIENDSPLPSNILGVEWTALYNSKSARYAI